MRVKKVLAMSIAASMAFSVPVWAKKSDSEPIEINFWHSMDGNAGDILNKQIEEFNSTVGAEKNIHVTATFQDWPGTETLTAAMGTDDTENMPDVIQLYGENVDLVRDWDRTVWAEDYITDDSDISKDDLMENAVSSFSINDKMIGVPYAVSTLLMYYNEDLLKEAGYENPAETLEELAQQMTDIKEKTSADYGLNIRMSYFEFVTYILNQGKDGSSLGSNLSGHEGYMTELTSQEQIETFLKEWQKVIDTGALKPTKDSMTEEFAQGLNAMMFLSSSRVAEVSDLVGDSFDWGVAEVPKVNADDLGGGYPSGSGLFMINRDDDEKIKASWEFEKFMLSADTQAMWLDGYSYTPVNKASIDSDTYKTAVEKIPQQSVAYDILMSMPATMVAPFCPASDAISNVITDSMLNFAQGDATEEETYTAITEGITDAFEEYFRANPVE